jgi:hypothetical protein
VVWHQNHSDGFCWFGLKTGGDGFSSIWSSKSMATVYGWFDLKITRTVFTGLASKPVATVSGGLASKPAATVFSSLASKLVVMVSPGLASKSVVGFLVESQNQCGGWFPGLGLNIGTCGLVIWASKSLQRFLGLCLKSKWALICRLCHKIDGWRSTQDTHRDLAACFTWKQFWLGSPSVA